MTVKILIGDVMEQLTTLEDDSIDCVVTSPPYWGLRDYGVEGQIGLEPTLGEHLAVMVGVFEEVKRVLKPTGTVWLNYGDCYATNVNGRSAADIKALSNDDRTFRDKPFSTVGPIHAPGGSDPFRRDKGRRGGGQNSSPGLKPKDLCMVPNRLAIALQEAGWWVRSEIVWAKSNPMPESITDRPATSHEKVFLLSKSPRYFYDATAVRVDSIWNTDNTKYPDGWDTGPGGHGSRHRQGREKGKKSTFKRANSKHAVAHHGQTMGTHRPDREDINYEGAGRNLRNWEPEPMQVWRIATRPFKEAHFATFPPELAARCIKAGSSAKGCCPNCGAPWLRISEAHYRNDTTTDCRPAKGNNVKGRDISHKAKGYAERTRAIVTTLGWEPSCDCEKEPAPAVILDPFGGAGTTGLVDDQLGRDSILIELNPEYVDIANNRLKASLISVEGVDSKNKTAGLPLFQDNP